MFINHLKIARRNLSRHKVFSMINVIGLALGMAGSLLIYLWIRDECSIGTHYKNASHLYRIYERQFRNGEVSASTGTPALLPPELKQQFPEIVYAAGLTWEEPHLVHAQEKILRLMGRSAGADWFRMYDLPLLVGNPATALQDPSSIAISQQMAQALFGGATQAMGKTIRLDHQIDYQVSAVFEDVPTSVEDKYDFLLSWSDFMTRTTWAKEWGTSSPQTRIQLKPGTNAAAFDAKIKSFLQGRHAGLGSGFNIELFLQPETKAHLYSDLSSGYATGGRIEYVRLFSVVAVFLLLIACINFMNLATARSVKRAKEVGVRKVLGAGQKELIGQFLSEALLLTLPALVLALELASLALPAFNALTAKQMELPLTSPTFWLALIGLWTFVGLLSGSYPALYLSSLQPVRVLKSAFRLAGGALSFRQGLVIFQFTLSILLIIGTLVVYRQLHYMQTKNLGYEKGNLIYLTAEGKVAANYETFKQELMRQATIQSITRVNDRLSDFGNSTNSVEWSGKASNQSTEFQIQSVGYDLIKTLKLEVQGRDFSSALATDSSNYLINEAAAKRLPYADPLGKDLSVWNKPGKIIGVVKDFHFGSLQKAIEPLIIRLNKNASEQTIIIRIQPGQTQTALAQIKSLYQRFNPDYPFSFQFAEADYERLYEKEKVVSVFANVFASLAIVISCLGLFGLAAFTAEQRTKEIGIRKVLGASIPGIVALLSRDLLTLVLGASLLAAPLAWYAMSEWLGGFAYRIELSGWIFVGAGLVALVVAFLTVSVQGIKAALLNPVKTLKSE
ncbi:ABC transporter permease [Siphonobacter sp. SORGH_AS_1065]|uniref:ABC transporter permease n=1 Tax=Siphonobacter sp. SORGH_AS_1065 TaxID=3041795 RepID=UPI002780040A|nr:ABC transporter permease [Siphonobacter sp. SORGH_AS_1065]MDQ1089791.1 putative ABC transport system permease protein [Siphonobacter sp. SORGH_AS_1065]